jgi:hypothetical protein
LTDELMPNRQRKRIRKVSGNHGPIEIAQGNGDRANQRLIGIGDRGRRHVKPAKFVVFDDGELFHDFLDSTRELLGRA